MSVTKKDIDQLEIRYNQILREKERQQVRLEEALKNLEEYGISEDGLDEAINNLETKISEMESKLESNTAKIEAKITKLEELI